MGEIVGWIEDSDFNEIWFPHPQAGLIPWYSETVIFTVMTSRCYNVILLILFAFYANTYKLSVFIQFILIAMTEASNIK